jgi:dihydrofolate reductase
MTKVFFDISVSLDGFSAGPDPSLQDPLGRDGERLHDWAFHSRSWRESHGREGGRGGVDSDLLQATIDRSGAHLMGRNMFSGGFTDGWEDDPRADGWWGDEPPFGKPVFVLTHHPREPLTLGETTFTFVTDGPAAALELAREAAGDRDVQISGGASVIRQCLQLGAVDDFRLHVAPVVLGGGTRLLEGLEGLPISLTGAAESPTGVMHLSYAVSSASSSGLSSPA